MVLEIMGFSYAVFFKTNQGVVYLHNDHAIIIPMDMSFLESWHWHMQDSKLTSKSTDYFISLEVWIMLSGTVEAGQ